MANNTARLPVIRVTAGLIIQSGKVFAAKRSAGRHLAGYWEFPGGKIEVNETEKDCLSRELAEELAISANIGEFFMKTCHRYQDKDVILHVYRVPSFRGLITLVDHDEYRWLSLEECKPLKWAPADLPIINQLSTLLV